MHPELLDSGPENIAAMNRALVLCVMLAGLIAAHPSKANPPDFRLQVVPAVVYKVDDPGNTGTSSLVFDIAVICSADCVLRPIAASVERSNGRSTVERQEWTPELLAIASANVRVQVADAKGRRAEQVLRIPIQYYHQKTSLILPFRGRGVVGQDWGTIGGHDGGIGTDFAIDVRGLDQNYAEQVDDADENVSAAGWGREILAPAAGTVTYARNDVPDNPRPGDPDSKALAVLHDPVMAFMGNCVIIDHGNSEYSVLAHLQHGSVTVRTGEPVAAGRVIGKLGSSGNSFGPHLHYQLQSGSQPFRGQSLPFRFQGVDGPQLSRGRYFHAR